MRVALTDLKSPLAATEPVWRANLERLLARAQFILGPELEAFESEFAQAMEAQYAVGVASGTAAIELCLRDAGIVRREQQVITSPLTAAFTGIAVLAAGASIRFADVDPETLLLDSASVAERVNGETAAIIPVHLYGQLCPIAGLSKAGVPLIQDACQAVGSRHALPSYTAYSFYPTKNLGCLGDGGAIVCDDPAIAASLRQLRDGGRVDAYVSARPGINARLDNIQCCFLRAFLPHLKTWNAQRARIAAYYDDALGGFEPVRPILRREPGVHHLYVVRTRDRDALREHLNQRGVGTGIHYPVPLHLQPAFAGSGSKAGDLPYAERACREIVSLPLHPYLNESDVAYVIEQVRSFY